MCSDKVIISIQCVSILKIKTSHVEKFRNWYCVSIDLITNQGYDMRDDTESFRSFFNSDEIDHKMVSISFII